MNKIKVLLADDQNIIREGIRSLLQDYADIKIVGEAVNGRQLVEMTTELEPDIVLTDIRMPIMDGVALALSASRDHPDLVIVLMTGYAGEKERAKGLNALVHDVILKPFTLPEMKKALNAALETRKPRPAFA